MRLIAGILALCLTAQSAIANTDVDRLIATMGVPALLQAFSDEGIEAGETLNQNFLNGQGGDLWAETVRRLYDPARLQAEMVDALSNSLPPDVTQQALLFFESAEGRKIVDLEVQARRAMQDPELETVARQAGADAGEDVIALLQTRDLIERNTDAAMSAQTAFFDGLIETSGRQSLVPNMDDRRSAIADETESWLRGYYALVHSPLTDDEIAVYTAFWKTDVGQALDDAMFTGFSASYTTLSFGLGQAAGRLLPQNEL
jgi:hypothetical protein